MDTRFGKPRVATFFELVDHISYEVSEEDIKMLLSYGKFLVCSEPDWDYMCRLDFYYYQLPLKKVKDNPNLDIPSRYLLVSSYNIRDFRRIGDEEMIEFLDRLENSDEFKLVKTFEKTYKIDYIGNDQAYYSSDLEMFFQKFYLYEKNV